MKLKLFSIALIASLAFSNTVFAGGCAAPVEPTIPEGAAATASDMFKAKKAVEAYMAEANKFLDCKMPRSKHNRMVTKMEKTAKKFNSSLKAYKSKA